MPREQVTFASTASLKRIVMRRPPLSDWMVGLEDGLWLFSSFCALHRTAFDPALFAQRFPAPIAAQSLAQAAEELGLRLEQRRVGLDAALAWRLPLAVVLRPAERPGTDAGMAEPRLDAGPFMGTGPQCR